jgi:hypothetical protein
MKKICLSALLAIGVLTAIFQVWSVSSAARPMEDYLLVCRGGGSLVIGIAPGEGNIGFSFTRGTKPADDGLAPGECSWVDRGMYPNEPDRVSQHLEEGSESLKLGGTLAAENRWYEELHSFDSYWTFMVSNNGRGQLIATSARPNKAKDVSPTARVPSAIAQILRRDLPSTPNDETPTIVALRGQAKLPSRMEAMKGLPAGRDLNIPLAVRMMTTDEQIEVLRSAGWKTLDEELTPYVTLTPQQPFVPDRGHLAFSNASTVDTGPLYGSGLAMWPSSGESGESPLWVDLYLKAKGDYFITFAVTDTSNPECLPKEACNIFSVELPDHSNHTFRAKGFAGKFMAPPFKLQYLTSIIHADTSGWYSLGVSYEARVHKLEWWHFWSCAVTVLK